MKILLCLVVLLAWMPFCRGSEPPTRQELVLASVLIGEAGGEGLVGMQAVADVIRNRATLAGTDAYRVTQRKAAFSVLAGGEERLYRKSRHHPRFAQALDLARQLMRQPSALPAIVPGATHFTNKHERPYWARGKRPLYVIGEQAFWKLKI